LRRGGSGGVCPTPGPVYCVLHIAGARNPGVDDPVVRGDGQEGREVGNELPREGPGLRHLWSSWRCRTHGVDTLDGALDKVRCVAGELEVCKALAGVKIIQDVQEELVEKSVLLRGDEEGRVRIIFGLEAVARVVLLEVEQDAWKTKAQFRCYQGTTKIGARARAGRARLRRRYRKLSKLRTPVKEIQLSERMIP
jgi:hypothetical protein